MITVAKLAPEKLIFRKLQRLGQRTLQDNGQRQDDWTRQNQADSHEKVSATVTAVTLLQLLSSA